MSSAPQQRQRVTVLSPFGQHQVDIPIDIPASGLLPDLLAVAGLHPSQIRVGSEGWRLEDADGGAVPPDKTLAEYGIAPGDVIQLCGLQHPGPDAQSGLGPVPAAGAGNGSQRPAEVPRGEPGVTSETPETPAGRPGPLERTAAVLPVKVGRLRRLSSAMAAYVQGPPAAAVRPSAAPEAAGPSPAEWSSPARPKAGRSAALPGRPPVAETAGVPEDLPGHGRPAGPTEQLRPRTSPAGRHRLLPADLTVAAPPTRAECARGRWRELDHLGQLDSRITEPRLRHCATIAVVSPKGGVGKTTVTALLGTLFALLRRDPTVAVDTNPDFGSLGRVLTPDQSWYVDDLARLVDEDSELSLTALDSQLGRAIHGLLVVPAPTDPARMASLDQDAYGRVITRLKDFFSLILLDCGTGLQDPASAAAIAAADQVVLLTDAQPATASLVAQSAAMLEQSRRPITVVVNRMPASGTRLDLAQLSHFLPNARGLVVIPDQVSAATRLAAGNFDWRDAPAGWQLAVRQLAVVLVADWRRLGLAQ
jgi:MinD-like ATPase involved in chromosome partitioning or flagellar assembly